MIKPGSFILKNNNENKILYMLHNKLQLYWVHNLYEKASTVGMC